MNVPAIISSLYHPLQPLVRSAEGKVSYLEHSPDERLRPLLYCYWELKTSEPLSEPFYYRVVADGCIDIFFEPGHKKEHFVMGFCRNYTVFPLADRFRYVGIRFLPTMFAQLFKTDASALTNRFEELELVLPKTGKFFQEHIAAGESFARICKILDAYFLALASDSSFNVDNRLYEALGVVLAHQGTLRLTELPALGISARQLRRLFDFYIGDSPKAFSQIVRFQHLLRSQHAGGSLRKDKPFFDSGYFDQSHFIKEFKTLYGLTPGQAFPV